MKLDRKIFDDIEHHKTSLKFLVAKLNTRINEIYNDIFPLFNREQRNMYFKECIFGYKYIQLEIDDFDCYRMMIIHNNEEINLNQMFPIDWLFSSSFEDDTIDGIEKYNTKMKKQYKTSPLKSKAEIEEITKNIKNKLSPEELKFISFKK